MNSIRFFVPALLLVLAVCSSTALGQGQPPPFEEALYKLIEEEGLTAAVRRYRDAAAGDSTGYDLGEGILNALGYRLLNEGRYDEAVAVLELNTEFYPGAINVWDSLGEALMARGDNERAIAQYEKVLEMLKTDSTLAPPARNFYSTNAQVKIRAAGMFDGRAVSDLQYVSFYGGNPAGTWDMDNLAAFKERSGLRISYSGNNLYFNPVPAIDPFFSGSAAADVTAGFMGGDYRRHLEEGTIADISSLWEEENWDSRFPASFKQMASFEGKPYFVPMAYQWNPVFYRKDIFDRHGLAPPGTWEELLALCDRLNELGYTPFTAGVQNWPPPVARWFTILNLRLNGPEFHEQVMRGEVAWTDGRVRDVFGHWRELFRRAAFSDSSFANTYGMAVQDLTSGRAVMYNLGEWLFESLNEEQGEQLDFFSFPMIRPGVERAEIVHAYGAFISAGTENREASEDLLSWLASVESQRSNAETNSRTVAHTGVDSSSYSEMQRRIIEQVNGTETLVPLFEMNTRPEFARRALGIFQEYWADPEDIDGAMEKLEAARREVFGAE